MRSSLTVAVDFPVYSRSALKFFPKGAKKFELSLKIRFANSSVYLGLLPYRLIKRLFNFLAILFHKNTAPFCLGFQSYIYSGKCCLHAVADIDSLSDFQHIIFLRKKHVFRTLVNVRFKLINR